MKLQSDGRVLSGVMEGDVWSPSIKVLSPIRRVERPLQKANKVSWTCESKSVVRRPIRYQAHKLRPVLPDPSV